jgi:hypothetical protein
MRWSFKRHSQGTYKQYTRELFANSTTGLQRLLYAQLLSIANVKGTSVLPSILLLSLLHAQPLPIAKSNGTLVLASDLVPSLLHAQPLPIAKDIMSPYRLSCDRM